MVNDEIKEIERRIELKSQHIKLLKLEIDDLEMRKNALMELYRRKSTKEIFDNAIR